MNPKFHVRHDVSRVGLLPQLVGLRRLLQLSGRVQVVVCLDGEPLPFAHLLPQLVSLARILRRPAGFVEVAVGGRHGGCRRMAKFGSSSTARL